MDEKKLEEVAQKPAEEPEQEAARELEDDKLKDVSGAGYGSIGAGPKSGPVFGD